MKLFKSTSNNKSLLGQRKIRSFSDGLQSLKTGKNSLKNQSKNQPDFVLDFLSSAFSRDKISIIILIY